MSYKKTAQAEDLSFGSTAVSRQKDPLLSVPSSQRVWLYRESNYSLNYTPMEDQLPPNFVGTNGNWIMLISFGNAHF